MRNHLLDLATKAFCSRRKWQQGACRRRAQFKTRLAVERLESRRLLAVTTFDNDNWNFVADNDASSSLTVGDTVRNDLDTFNPGTVTGTYGVDAFGTVTGGAFTGSVAGAATINDAINSTDVGGTVNVLEGTYLESVAVNKTGLTLRGATGIATDVVIDPPAGNGITVSANGVTILDLRVTGGVDGINSSSVDNLTISNVRADGNVDDGIDLSTITGLGTLSSIIASTNGDAGLVAQNLAAVSVTDGIFNQNTNHGIQLIDVAGLVSLTRVTANDNDANVGGIGDGVNMIDGADAGTDAIGSLLVVGGSFSDTAAAGVQRFGIRVGDGIGVGAVHSVAGTVTFQSDTIAGPLQHISITGNRNSGVEIEDGGTTASITGNGNYSGNGVNGPNQGTGFTIASLSGTFTVGPGNTFSNNTSHGISLVDITGAVSLTGSTASDNGGNGLNAVDGGDLGTDAVGGLVISGSSFNNTAAANVQLTGINVGPNTGSATFSDDGATANSVTGNTAGGVVLGPVTSDVSITSTNGATYSNNTGGDGIDIASLGGALTVSGITASTNSSDGLLVSDGGTTADISSSTFSGNGANGIELNVGAGSFSNNVTLTSVTANSNTLDGVHAINLTATTTISGGTFGTTGVGNGDDGLDLSGDSLAGTNLVVNALATASGNGDAGLVARNFATVSVTDGIFNQNTNHGIQLVDIAGLVSLTRVTANDNDANVGGIGDGVNMVDGADAGTDAIGSLLVVGGSFSDTAAAGVQRFGIRVGDGIGVGAVHSVATTVDFQSDTVAEPLQHISITGNRNSGVEIEDGGTTGSFTDGFYSGNTVSGINLNSFGTLSLSDLTITGNTGGGGSINNVTTLNFTGTTGNVTDVIAVSGTSLQHTRDPSGTNVVNQSLSLTNVATFNTNGDEGSDTFNVIPAVSMTINVDGDLPTPPALPGDTLNVDISGTTGPNLTSTSTLSGLQGSYTFGDRQPVNFQEIESLGTAADLTVTKDDAPDPVTAGTNLTYTITLANIGDVAAQNVNLSDAVPSNTTFVSFTAPAGWASSTPAVGGTGTVSASISSLAAGSGPQVFTLVVNVNASAPSGPSLSNTATASTTTPETDSTNNSDTETTSVNTISDLSITKDDSPDPVTAGQNLTYTILVTNNGSSDAQSVSLSDLVPVSTTFVSFTSPAGWSSTTPAVGGTGTVSSSISTLAAGASATFTLVVNANASTPNGSTLSNTATVSSTTTDPTPGNNSDTETTAVVTSADLSVTKDDSPDPVTAGQNLTYTILVTNNGSSDAQSVSLSDLVPVSTTFVSFTSPAGWSSTTPAVGGTGTVSSSISTLAAGASATFTLVVNANASTPNGSTLSNTATVSSTTTDPTPGNNSDTETTAVVNSADLSVTKSDSPDPVTAGQNLTYTILVTNNGPSDSQGVSLTDAIPANTTFVSFTAPAGWASTTPPVGGTGTVTATTSTLAAGASATFTLVVQVRILTLGGTVISNTATVDATTIDSNDGNDSDTEETDVVRPVLPVCEVLTLNSPGSQGSAFVTNDADHPGQGVLIVTGTSQNDIIVVEPQPHSAANLRVTLNGRTISIVPRSSVQHIVAYGLSGNDKIVVNGSLTQQATLFGNDGKDELYAARGNDGLDGGAGNDRLFGGDGNDVLCGGDGNDDVYGQNGNDVCGGDAGNDRIWGEGGNDLLLGGDGNDGCYGGANDDRVYGQAGNDQVFGDGGNDVVVGGNGNDKLFGGQGRDLLIGGNGNDTLDGEAHDDLLVGDQTAHDQDDIALMLILAEWASSKSYATRVNNIRNGGGQNLGFVLNNTTVFDDGRVDTLWGHAGQDWFLIGVGDKIKDKANNEQVN